jgi:hypothetical protein
MNKKQMDKLNLTELKALAKEEGMKGYSTMTKPALLSHLSGGAMLGGASKFENLNVDQLRGYIKGKTGISVAKVKKPDLVQMAKGEKDVPEKPKRTGNAWVQALKQYNSGKSVYMIPKQGSAEYNEVKAIMNGKQVKPVKKTRKAKKEEVLYL